MSYLFVITSAEHVSTKYHDDGAVIAVAPDLDAAIALIESTTVCRPEVDHWIDTPDNHRADTCYAVVGDDYQHQFYPLVSLGDQPRVMFFPDAGCC